MKAVKKLLCLGAGFMQMNAIRKARSKGYTIVVADYLPDAPGKALADYAEMTSTFDVEGNIGVAARYGVQGVFTIGTDQPVYTAACVAEALGLSHPVTAWTALRATHKKYMKETFAEAGIPCSRSIYIRRDQLAQDDQLLQQLSRLRFPVVVKPFDSQGQRGIYKIPEPTAALKGYMQDTFRYTRCEQILVEEFFTGDEITVSAWVTNGQPYILMITDRPLINVEPHLGVPDGHIFPSIYASQCWSPIQKLVERIAAAFHVCAGPLYVQMMIRGEELMVVEVACRIGGGHEEELIPLVTGIDVVDLLIDAAAGQAVHPHRLRPVYPSSPFGMVRFVVAQPGPVREWGDLSPVLSQPGVVKAGFYHDALTEVEPLVDSTKRVGYLLVEGNSYEDLEQRAANAYAKLKILDPQGRNLAVDTHRKNGFYQVYSKGDGL